MRHDQIREGRLAGSRSDLISHYLSSMEADSRIATADILVDMAHLAMLRKQSLIQKEHVESLAGALLGMYREGIPAEAFDCRFEDIHAGIEGQLIAEAGMDAGGRLHLARSRNDEVATCLRMRVREDILGIIAELAELRNVLITTASEHSQTVMPGFTHLQHAQPTTLGHHLLAYEEAFSRDCERLTDAYARVNRCPLGSAAFASTGFAIDREMVCRLLGFDEILGNSMDAVSGRDFALETLATLSILMTNASRLCEELILWSSAFFGFVELDDAYCSTSSIMPQKKNPDCAEIMRGHSGTVAGAFQAALVCLKGLPMSYNRDLQTLTPHLWAGISAAHASTGILSGMIATARFNPERMAEESGKGFSTATELADTLVREFELPFRTAHNIVGRAVRSGSLTADSIEAAGREIGGVSLVERGLTEERIARALDPAFVVASKQNPGGPAVEMIRSALAARQDQLARDTGWISDRKKTIQNAEEELVSMIGRLAAE
ncbi:MAG: argininosuccinate lyase [Methanocalculus sp. MSAO_Arc1]|uniref:argininosuccinate lyase n=1 Tax=Methanocalculus TaxID=71151 RepID=UPI000FF78469|nr:MULTISPECIES: argininosuccinate lyase [unclassified Methanocalculus]MCP1663198.1 argininosuccinate lyase [Methanocalculus sp. AMF5]RQD79718.1 MAG: argininosuccinate lyase [Methanocalculus sp. MSAO_Arc1]